MTGNSVFGRGDPRFLLDESLAPPVARALQLVGYDIQDVVTVFGSRGVKDPEIIEWCREEGVVWIHADDRARKQHKALLQRSGTNTLWIKRPRGHMSGKEQLRIIAFVLPKLMARFEKRPSVRHYRATALNDESTPSLREVDL